MTMITAIIKPFRPDEARDVPWKPGVGRLAAAALWVRDGETP